MDKLQIVVMDLGLEELDDGEGEFAAINFNPSLITTLHEMFEVEPTETWEHKGEVEYDGPYGKLWQYNHFILLDLVDGEVPIDWKIANVVQKMNDMGIKTYGAHQGFEEDAGIQYQDMLFDTGYITFESKKVLEVAHICGASEIELRHPPNTAQ